MKTTRCEVVEINEFIKAWTKTNEYKGNLTEHNAKFRKEFVEFLEQKNYSEETKQLFKIK